MSSRETCKTDVMIVLGTRPEATKLAPVILELRRFPEQFCVQVVSTGQHRELLPGIRKQLVSDCVLPHVHAASLLPGSSDVGDVSWLVPTAQCSTACYVFGTPGHSWQMVAQGTSSLAHQGMLTAAKALARTALELFTQPELIQAAKAELLETLDGRTYQCPIPPDVQPPL